LRGDKQRLVYKGRRRSHRFTILGDTAFEYDCVLEKEPYSNVISLRMEGVENFDFFRQPDFVKEQFLKGSYAVYKKDTLVGEGTGKLCHIHKPEIIDARGRRCWGELSVVGNELRITIPENWLAEAKYPVVVDPTVGTTTVGSFIYATGVYVACDSLTYEIGVNKFLAPESIEGQCTAYIYCALPYYTTNPYSPRIFDDNNNKPLTRRSYNEATVETNIVYYDSVQRKYVPGPSVWKPAAFEIINRVNQGAYIWFGGYGGPCHPKYDYGAVLYKTFPEMDWEIEPDEWYDEETDEWHEIEGVGTEILDFPYFGNERTFDCKFSWYFDFIRAAQNYVCRLTQGVTLADNKRTTEDYKRSLIQTASINSTFSRFAAFARNCVMAAGSSMSINRLPVFFRSIAEIINTYSETERKYNAIRKVQEILNGIDRHSLTFFYIRSVPETVKAEHILRNTRGFFRGLLEYAGSIAETACEAGYYRTNADTVQATGAVFRGLLIFARIVTKVFVRDYLLGRFLKSKAELSIKSCVCREITLESRVTEK